MNHKYYILSFSAKHCLLQVRVNDLLAFAKDVTDKMSLDLPVNNFIPVTGQQELSCSIKPNLSETVFNSDFVVNGVLKSVLIDSVNGSLMNEKHILEFRFDEQNLPRDPLPFFADVPYELDFWNNTQNLTRQSDLNNLLTESYQHLNQLLQKQQYDAFLRELMVHDSNLARSMFWEMSSEISQKRQQDFISLLSAGFVLKSPSADMHTELYGYGNFVRPCAADGNTALSLWHPGSGEEYPLDLYFRKLCNCDILTLI